MPARLRRKRGHRPAQEQFGAGHRVRRIGEHDIERTGQRRRERPPEIVLDRLHSRPGAGHLLVDPAEDVGVGIHHHQPPDRGRAAGQGGEAGNRDGNQVIIAEQQDPLAGERPGLMQPQHPGQLGLHGAVRLVQLGLRAGHAVRDWLQGGRETG